MSDKTKRVYRPVSVSMSPEIIEAIKSLAEEENRSFSGQVLYIIKQYTNGRSNA